MDSMLHDLRYAVRALWRTPGFTATAVLTLALGIALNTTAFSVYDAVALRPLAVPSPQDVVRLTAPRDRSEGELFPYTTYRAIRGAAHSLAGVVATTAPELVLTRYLRMERDIPTTVRFVSDNYFSTLGVLPAQGRTPGPSDESALVVSEDFWRRQLAADPGVVGSTLFVQNQPMTVAGVAPSTFAGTGSPPSTPDLFIPAAAQPRLLPGGDWLHDPSQRQWQILARLAPRQSVAGVRAELAVIARSLAPADTEVSTLSAKPATLFQTDSGEFQTFGQVMEILLVAVGIILFIGAGNLIGLVTARNAGRGRELAVRAALGASRRRIARLLVLESVVVGLSGGAVGLLVAAWLGDLIRRWLAGTLGAVSGGSFTTALDLSPDWRIVVFTAGISILVGLLVGIWPTLQVARRDLQTALKGTTESAWGRRRGHALLVAQLAVSLMLLTGASLLIGGARRARHIDPGFDADHILLLDLNPQTLRADPSARTALLARVAERLRELPDVRSVAWTDRPPMAGHAYRTVSQGPVRVTFSLKAVSGDYFDAIGARIISGRAFTPEEVAGGRDVMIVSASVARRYWPGQDPVGRTVFDHPWLARRDSGASTIVGVVADMRGTYLSRVDDGLYYPQPLSPGVTLVVRARSAPAAIAQSVLAALAGVDPLLPTQATLVSLDDGPMRIQRMMSDVPAALAGGLAAIGLLLAAVGLYGVVIQLVTRRTREIGVRMALGASRWGVVQMVLGGSLRPAFWGAVLGLVGAGATAAGFASLLAMPDAPDLTYGGGAFDPRTFATVVAVLGVVVILATIAPTRRALNVDPVEALRAE
ncbi:MAG TPA: ADOP family duplicated permease [Gemmatimonadales bacterium]|nr:ADOP family duplicated permease [Gemmatimonadales bacterium]